ncbi:MAG: L-threonylcarbamoyladenylate synthase [Nanoarchaeota archaeon]|nr:L-threonylcarbamoyladenylate synthase [Nanoarchaeota archaeon]
MKTILLKINPKKPQPSLIQQAATLIKQGQLVAFPTETVYGLGADAFNTQAVQNIFKAKGRPADNPLIVHIAKKKEFFNLTTHAPALTKKLIQKFWPGPLTIVCWKNDHIPDIVTAGLPKVALRMPKNNIALHLITAAGTPIAAPSANLSGKPSPTTAEHVLEDFHNAIPCIIDGGKTNHGIESTVLDITTQPPTLLRPGSITKEQLEQVIGTITLHPHLKTPTKKTKKPASPGMKYRHYSPTAPVILVIGKKAHERLTLLAQTYRKKGKNVGIISTKRITPETVIIKHPKHYAQQLYAAFRRFDAEKKDVILVEGIAEQGLGLSIMNRITKAASKIIKT